MKLKDRINDLVELGQWIQQDLYYNSEVISKAIADNPWFTRDSINQALKAVSLQYLSADCLSAWVSGEQITETTRQKIIGIVMAGNIPLVGIHDLLAVLITGHKALIKASDRDLALLESVVHRLYEMHDYWRDSIELTHKLSDLGAVIATGSDSTARYFEKYFSAYPHIIRKNRHGVGIVFKDDTVDQMKGLADDVLSYFGLGCRNISKLYLEKGVEIDSLFEHFESHGDTIHHNKYKNNYDYNYALFLLNKDEFYTNNFLLLKKHDHISSRIASVHYEYFDNTYDLKNKLNRQISQIQCVMSSRDIDGLNCFRFGYAQKPGLTDYADGVNTIEFLKSLDGNS